MTEINNIAEMQKGVTFLWLIQSKKIQIPIIQRDYAQGRLDEKATEIRDGFLNSLIEALTLEDSKPLVLDFVYGSTNKDNVFVPLDGQQRLTTLFLLHWYLASDEKLALLKTEVKKLTLSKFTYETRISSKDFCNSLICYCLKSVKANNSLLLSKSIKNQHWFMWGWRKDPTVKAMMVMLNEMDSRLGNLTEEIRKSMWSKLEDGRIIFHLLPLEQFKLSDELYVKMNARGMELSKFDIFKSTLEEQMRLNDITAETQNNWRCNVDSNWIDLFWNKLAKSKLANDNSEAEQVKCVDSVEDNYLRFLKRMMVYYLFINEDCFKCDWNDGSIRRYMPFDYNENNILNLLRDFSVRNEVLRLMPLFCKTEFFSQTFFDFIINSFESIIYHVDKEKHDGSELIQNIHFEVSPKTIFEAFIDENITYDTRVHFFALLQFFKYNKACDTAQDEDLKTEFNSWMRVIRNLSTNTNTYFYNGYDDFLKSLITVKKWAEEIYAKRTQPTIISFLKAQNRRDGFNIEQLDEEKGKATLIDNSTNWADAITTAEEHKYFLGQIRFLLRWSKSSEGESEKYDLFKFNEYYNKISSAFGNNGLFDELCKSDTHTFRNALMSNFKNYFFNGSFIENTAKSRDYSWKRYLRDNEKSENIKKLLDKWDNNQSLSFKEFCENEIKLNSPSDWRKYFIEKPEIYNELYNDRLSFWNSRSPEVCLLSKIRWSSRHKELRTFYWYLKYKTVNDRYLDSAEETNPFSAVFNRDSREFSVKFIPKWNNSWQKGTYVVSSNYDPQIVEMQENISNCRWEHYIDSDNSDEVEKLLVSINNHLTVSNIG